MAVAPRTPRTPPLRTIPQSLKGIMLGAALLSSAPRMIGAAEQTQAAATMASDQQRRGLPEESEAEAGNLMKGDIGGGATRQGAPSGAPGVVQGAPAATAGAPGGVGAQAEAVAKRRLEQLREGISKEMNKFRGSLGARGVLAVIRKVPGLNILLNTFEKLVTKAPEMALNVLVKIENKVKLAERLAVVVEGVVRWVQAFVATLETIVVPILLLIALPFWLIILFGGARFVSKIPFLSKLITKTGPAFEKILTEIGKAKEQLQKFVGHQKKLRLAFLKTVELERAVEAQAAQQEPRSA